MALSFDVRGVTVDRLGPPDLADVFAFLGLEPVQNVYLLALALRDALARPRDEVWGARRDGVLVALVHLGGHSGAILPVGDDLDALELLAAQALARRSLLPRRSQLIGPRQAVWVFRARFAAGGVHPRLARDQLYLALQPGDLSAFERLPDLRPAGPADLALVHDSGAQLRTEELDEDPRLTDAAAYGRRVEDECRDGYTYLWTDADGLCFRASVSAATVDAAQVSGVYTPAARRRSGYARRALAELCVRLFERTRVVCLFVNDFNAPALALYRAMGFRVVADWASVFYDPA